MEAPAFQDQRLSGGGGLTEFEEQTEFSYAGLAYDAYHLAGAGLDFGVGVEESLDLLLPTVKNPVSARGIKNQNLIA